MSVTVLKPDKKTSKVPTKAPEKAPESYRHPVMSLREEIDRLFDTFFTGPALRPFGRWDLDWPPFKQLEERFRAPWPKVDVAESDKAFTVTAELPGMEEDDIKVTLAGDCLTLTGEKRHETVKEGEHHHLMERSYGSVRRTFRVPEMVDASKVGAEFENGVLTVTLPKAEQAAPKPIEIKKAGARKAKKAR